MIFRTHAKSPTALVPGLVFLIVANVGSYMLKRTGTYSESIVDGASGLLFGVAIALLLRGVWVARRETPGCRRLQP
jgi:membrane associated rhomboid family serine protease